MSSQSLPHTPTPGEHRDALREAVVEVAENSFFAYVEPSDPERFADQRTAVPAWIQSSVLFDGPFGGAVQVVVPEALARDLFAAFLGADPDVVALDAPLFDLMGELGNMVCGAWLTRTCHRSRFDLQPPAVSRLRSEEARPDLADCLFLAINDQPAYVRLGFAGE